MNPLIQLKQRTPPLQFLMLLFSWSLLSIATGQEEGLPSNKWRPQFSGDDYDHYCQENNREKYTTVEGVIEAVEPVPNGATIRLRTERVPDFYKREKPPPKKVSFNWNTADGPPPLCRGMKPTVTLNASGNVVDITFIAAITHWRKRGDGLVEVVLGYKDEGGPLRYLCVCPAKTDGFGTNVHWTRKWGGTLITTDGLDPETVEIEPAASGKSALSMANVAGMKIVPGRDGWKALPSVNEDKRPMTPAEYKAWGAFQNAIPKSQQMKGAG